MICEIVVVSDIEDAFDKIKAMEVDPVTTKYICSSIRETIFRSLALFQPSNIYNLSGALNSCSGIDAPMMDVINMVRNLTNKHVHSDHTSIIAQHDYYYIMDGFHQYVTWYVNTAPTYELYRINAIRPPKRRFAVSPRLSLSNANPIIEKLFSHGIIFPPMDNPAKVSKFNKVRESGKVKWFNEEKGYGFILVPNSTDLFIHYTDILRSGFQTLAEDECVTFNRCVTNKGNVAINVQ